MKNLILISILFLSFCSYSQKITRGPDVGEIYFIGPTYTGTGLYYSTDSGETAICVDSSLTTNVMTITADKSNGIVYYVTSLEGLYRSDSYGNQNSWQLVSGNIYLYVKSGVNEGFIYNAIVSHSENYGVNFLTHSYNGFFGNLSAIEIDNEPTHGYAIVSKSSVPDSSYLLVTNDNFENLTLQNVFNKYENPIGPLTRGEQYGELFTLVYFPNNPITTFKHSEDYGFSWSLENELNISEPYNLSCEGGRQYGEVYILYSFINLMLQNAHIYIYHSTNYGKTFEVYHPFSKGSEPVLANFSTINKEVHLTTPVEFSNFSIGEIQEYQWDFDNDGTIDSYDESPIYIYQDTGWYSVKLSVVGIDSINTFTKENYIHVLDTTTRVFENLSKEISILPNPFNEKLTITSVVPSESHSISIYNLKGEKVIETFNQNNILFMINTSELNPGVYVLKISNQNYSLNYKIIKK